MVSRRLYFGVCIVLPLFCIFFMSTIFGNGQMENIPVGIVDGDNTSMSREVVRTVEAVPTFKVKPSYLPFVPPPLPHVLKGFPACHPVERNIRLPRDPYWFHG